MTKIESLLLALKSGPKSAAELATIVNSKGAYISRDCAKLIKERRVKRIDGGSGRGSLAIYALTNDNTPAPVRRRGADRLYSDAGGPSVDPARIVHRDPCTYCGVRGDLGCKCAERIGRAIPIGQAANRVLNKLRGAT